MPSRISAAVFLIAFLPWKAAADEIPPRVIIRDPTHITMTQAPQPWLIPTRLLTAPYSSWSQENQERAAQQHIDAFNDQVETVRRLSRSGDCRPALVISCYGSGQSPARGDRRLSVVEVAGTRKNVLIGEVIAIEPAWDTTRREISSLVHLKVQQVVRGVEPIGVSDIVTFRRDWGEVTVSGVTLCSYPENIGSQPPLPSQDLPESRPPAILILGRLVPGNSLFLDTHEFEEFPVIDGKIHYPERIPYYHGKEPEDLEGLIGQLQRITQ